MYFKYVYAIINYNRYFRLSTEGFFNSPVYTIPYKDISAAVSDIPSRSIPVNRENLWLHETIVEYLFNEYTILPMRFSSIWPSEEAVINMMRKYYDNFYRNLKNLNYKVEMGVKILWPVEEILSSMKIKNLKLLELESKIKNTKANNYLQEKMKDYLVNEALKERAQILTNNIQEYLTTFVESKKSHVMVTRKMMLNGVYLLNKNSVDGFKHQVQIIKKKYPYLKFLVSGPWPPYNFIKINSVSGLEV
ncbi:MAG: hypothetical protein CVU88_00900 [Firmicutes bacterium HGW-Firmicutes-13]|nr:MAG: hypothetical protein CVU88_00900 [Firmicutes bacterium HGW-Firmicutes-13]